MEQTPLPTGSPYLEYYPEPGGVLQRVSLSRFPFRVGRDANADLTIYCPRVSKSHAELRREGNLIAIADLGSTNGTFINGRRVQTSSNLNHGDIVHIANKEFRFVWESVISGDVIDNAITKSTILPSLRSAFQDAAHLSELIERGEVSACFQPIIDLGDRQQGIGDGSLAAILVGFEALGRGCHRELPTSPGPLFALAQERSLAVQLSRAFRRAALIELPRLPSSRVGPSSLFLNVHPDELPEPYFPEHLKQLTEARSSSQMLVLEVHEGFVADLPTLQYLRSQLQDLNMQLAYDDFGVGQARLTALTEVPADYVKLDITIVQGLLHSRHLRELVRALGEVCADLGTRMIAEGVESEEEAAVCLELGCQLGQGYLFARPQAADAFARTLSSAL